MKIWVALFVGSLVAVEVSGRTAFVGQVQMAFISFGVGFVSYEDLALYAGRGEPFSALIASGLFYVSALLVLSVVADREMIKTIILAWIGGSKR